MKLARLIIPFLFIYCTAGAQVETVVSDGIYGIRWDEIDDTIVITSLTRGAAAESAGLHEGDKIICVDGHQISGADLNYEEMEQYFSGRAGSETHLQIQREASDALLSYKFNLYFSRDMWGNCYYDYLVDSLNQYTPEQFFYDTCGIQFYSSPVYGATVHSLVQDSIAGIVDIRAGDRLLSFDEGDNTWAKLWFKEYKDADTIIKILRDSTVFELHEDLRDYPELKINSVFAEDMKQESMWLRLIFTKKLVEDRTILLRWHDPYDSIFLYQRSFDGSIQEKRSGYALSMNEREAFFKDNPVIRVNISKEVNDTMYVRVFQTGGVNFAPSMDFLSFDYVVQFEQTERIIYGAILGMILIIIFYYLILYIFLKEKSYFVYLLFIISLGFTLFYISGYGPQFVWHNSVEFFSKIEVLFLTVPLTVFILYESLYLDIKNTLKRWYQAGVITLLAIWLVSILVIVNSAVNNTNLWTIFETPLSIAYGICIALLAVIIYMTAILRIRQGCIPARFFLYGIIVLSIFILYYSLRYVIGGFLWKQNADLSAILMHASIHFGVIIQFLLFAIGHGKKMRDSEWEIKQTQDKLIDQLRENEKLKDEQNKELEDKVKKRTREIIEQKEEIEAQRDLVTEQNKEITDSINYAKKIQTAVLPSDDLLNELLPEHFVLFKPRDIVSGDFFWIKQIKNFTVVVAADCTGHGVPGAFMSMLGVSMLNEIVGRSRLDSAGEFLNRLRSKVKSTLSQEGKELEQKDGMDMSLAILDKESNELQYAGAFNPIYILRNKPSSKKDELSAFLSIKQNRACLYEIKGDRQPISIYSKEKEFKTNYIQLYKDDSLYMFSDGYPDQMGGPRGKKFMVKKFKELLLSIQNESMIDQKEILDNTLSDWKKDVQQIDDILVFGIKWK